ncbi:MAG: O-antigen ligase family protein, partial [bacterium]|nr:O-antigen ligase family protein [bacterium]
LIFVFTPFLPDEYKDRMQTITETREASIRTRFDAWIVAGDTIIRHPFLGVGPGVFQREFVYNAITSPGIKTKFLLLHAHNLYLNVAAESGVPAVTMLILLIYFSWKYFRKSSLVFEKKGDMVLSNISAGFEISIMGFSLMNMVSSHIEALIFWILLGISVVMMELSNAN